LAAFCSTMPTDWIRNTNDPADPSRMGISGAVTSTWRLSMPSPATAAMRCSTVATRTEASSPSSAAVSVEAMRVSVTRSGRAAISTGGSRSTRRKTMPVSAAAGRSVSSTRWPECSPTPVALTRALMVRCRIISLVRVRSAQLGQHRLGVGDLELAGRLDGDALDHAVVDQHRVAVGAHAHAARGEVELEAQLAGELARAVGHHAHLV